MQTLAFLFALLLTTAAWSQSTSPLDAFTRNRLGDPGAGPGSNGGDSCDDCHRGSRVAGDFIGGWGHRYLGTQFVKDVATGIVFHVFRNPTPSGPQDPNPPDFRVSLRMPLTLFGDHFINDLPDSAIAARSDAFDVDGDGISGRAVGSCNHFRHPPTCTNVGRFGSEAQWVTLEQAIREGAFVRDFDITEAEQQSQNIHAPSGMTWQQFYDAEVALLVQAFYTVFPTPPPFPNVDTARAARGLALFEQVGCADCHVTDPGWHYSDFLLHDCGRSFDDGVRLAPSTGQREMRTAELENLKLDVAHDGSNTTVSFDDFVRRKGGECVASANGYFSLNKADRGDLGYFVLTR